MVQFDLFIVIYDTHSFKQSPNKFRLDKETPSSAGKCNHPALRHKETRRIQNRSPKYVQDLIIVHNYHMHLLLSAIVSIWVSW